MPHRYIFLVGILFFVGCGNPTLLTAPLCPPGQWDLPHEYEGDYSVLMQEPSSEYGGMWLFKNLTVSIQRTTRGALQLFLNDASPQILEKVRRQAVLSYSAICEIGGSYYYQEAKSEGFVVSKLNLGTNFFDVAGVVFHPQTLKAANIPFYLLPMLNVESVLHPDHNPFGFDLMSTLQVVVDNRGIDASTLLEYGHPLSMTYSLHRISPQKTYGPSWVKIR